MELNIRSFGEGKPVIIFHGLLGSLDNWISISKILSKKNKVILVDLPNHGKSYHTKKFSYQKMSESIHNFLINNKIDNISIIGHSMGGKLALNYVDNYKEHVNKLIIVDVANKTYSSNRFDNVFKAINSIDLDIISSRNQASDIVNNLIPCVGERNFILKNLKRNDSGFVWAPNIELLEKSIIEISSRIKLKQKITNQTLFLFGKESTYYNNNDILNLSHDFENFDFKLVPCSGHWIHAENPKAFINYTTEFLKL